MDCRRIPQRLLHDKPDNSNRSGDPPRTLSQLLLPQLSRPSLCAVSLLLLVMIHAISLLESAWVSYVGSGSGSGGDESCHEALTATNLSYNHQDQSCRHKAYQVDPPPVSHLTIQLLQRFHPRQSWLALLLLLSLAMALLFLQYTRLSKIISTTSPVPGIAPVPGAHPYMGHYAQLLNHAKHDFLFRRNATPSGVSAMWGPGLKRCASVLLASHARLVLRPNSERDFSDWIVRHGRKTLGEDSLILIAGGQRWKNVRKVVAKAFTNRIVRDSRRVVGACARELVDWLERAMEEDGGGAECCDERGANDEGEGKGSVRIEAENFFKAFSLNVFGRVAMGHDFQCVPKGDGGSDGGEARSGSQQRQRFRGATCGCLRVPPEAKAFEFLGADIGSRASPQNFLNPAMQMYWIPTKHNRTYHANMELVSGLMGSIIRRELDQRLRTMERRRKKGETIPGSDDDTTNSTEDELEQESAPENMVTHLVKSCMEQHFSQSRSSQSPSKCPFTSMGANDGSDIPPPSSITNADKQKIIRDVTKMLHTMLVAGYETVSVSLSYAVYCLSKNPRCQDRACEEARRVLGNRRNGQVDDVEEVIDDADLCYCRAVFTESLRMHLPVLFTTRVLSKDLTLDTGLDGDDNRTCTLLKGTRVFINPLLIHLDERNYERASEFLPERWVRWDDARGRWVNRDYAHEVTNPGAEDDVPSPSRTRTPLPSLSSAHDAENARADAISAADPANFFSFSDGARNCVGQRLAVMESTILIATLFRDMRVSLTEENFELVKQLRFVTVKPARLPLVFWNRGRK